MTTRTDVFLCREDCGTVVRLIPGEHEPGQPPLWFVLVNEHDGRPHWLGCPALSPGARHGSRIGALSREDRRRELEQWHTWRRQGNAASEPDAGTSAVGEAYYAVTQRAAAG